MRIVTAAALLALVALWLGPPPAKVTLSAQQLGSPRPSSTFVVSYDPNFEAVPAAKAAFQAAVAIWSTTIVSPVPIRIRAALLTSDSRFSSGVRGTGRPAMICQNGATWYAAALWDTLAGGAECAAWGGSDVEIVASFSADSPWDYGTTGVSVPGKYSFMTVALHAIAHGLGFYGSANGNDGASQLGRPVTTESSLPDIFDRFAIRGDGTPLLQLFELYPSYPSLFVHTLLGNDVYFYGPYTKAYTGGAAKLQASSSLSSGSTLFDGEFLISERLYDHLDDVHYQGTANGLMTPSLHTGEVYTDVGPVLKGILADLGWTVEQRCSYAVSSSTATVSGHGGSGIAIAVAAPAGCPWNAVSHSSAVTITNGGAGTGFGAVQYTVSANPLTTPRVFTMTIAGYPVTITQPPRRPPIADFDGDGRSDFYVWRASTGTWYWASSGPGGEGGDKQWGNQAHNDVPLLADLDGDGKSDLIIWRPGEGMWHWLTSSSGYNYASAGSKPWGSAALGDVPLLGDIDGDLKADLIVWRASTGTWHWLTSSTGYDNAFGGSKQWGSQAHGDIPMVGDLDGDGRTDLIVWRAPEGMWHWLKSSSAYANATGGSRQWGAQANGDQPLVADFDGDGKGDLAFWRAPTGRWHWLNAANGYASGGERQWGDYPSGDVPRLPDLDGDGRADLAVWRGPSGEWIWLPSSTIYSYAFGLSKQFGNKALGDVAMTGK